MFCTLTISPFSTVENKKIKLKLKTRTPTKEKQMLSTQQILKDRHTLSLSCVLRRPQTMSSDLLVMQSLQIITIKEIIFQALLVCFYLRWSVLVMIFCKALLNSVIFLSYRCTTKNGLNSKTSRVFNVTY